MMFAGLTLLQWSGILLLGGAAGVALWGRYRDFRGTAGATPGAILRQVRRPLAVTPLIDPSNEHDMLRQGFHERLFWMTEYFREVQPDQEAIDLLNDLSERFNQLPSPTRATIPLKPA